MTTPVLVAVARPYASGSRHLGHLAAVPGPGPLTAEDEQLLADIDDFIIRAGEQFEAIQLRTAPRTGMDRAQAVNQYVTSTEPWKLVKSDFDRARTVFHTALSAVNGVRVMLAPYLPFSAAALDEILGPADGWRRAELEVGRPIDKPTPLFQKIDVEADAD